MSPRTLVAALALALLASPVHAQDAGPRSQDEVLAEGLFREGRRAAEGGDFETACARFRDSYRIDPAIGTLLNVADCEEQRGKIATAWGIYHEVQGKLDPTDDRHAYVERRIREIEPGLPRLTVHDRSGLAGVTLTCDGTALGEASVGVALPVDPGGHVVLARTADGRQARFEVTLARSEAREIVVTRRDFSAPRAPNPSASRAAAPRADAPSPTRKTVGLAMIAGGGVALAASVVTGALALARSGDVEDECGPNYDDCSDEGVAAADSGRLFATVSTVAFAVGVLGVGGGVTLILTAPSGPGPAPSGVGARVSGRW